MRHDALCERDRYHLCLACKCASRAYAANPLPNDWTPIWAKAKTPGQEGG